MGQPRTSKKKAQAISTALFLLALAALVITDAWWPGIMLAIGLPLALRQHLLGRTYDAGISLLVFVGTFITAEFDISWKILLPSLFTIGAIYVLVREFVESEKKEDEEEKEENTYREMDEK